MKRLALLTAGAVALAGGSAGAADIPIKAPPKAAIVAPAQGWAGFYFGVHGGYGWKRNDFAEVISVVPLLTLGGIDSDGWVLGGQAGHNWQFGPWVAGLEIDFSAARIRGDSAPVVRDFGGGLVLTDTVGDDVKWLGTARARVGFTPFDSVLFYGTGGLAWERVNRTETTALVTPGLSQTVITTDPRDWFGWVAGAGVEAKLFGSSNWIGRVEYLHYDFGAVESTTVATTVGAPGTFADRAGGQTIDVVRAGVSYRWAPGMPASVPTSMPVKAPPVYTSAQGWAGFYFGIHGGYGWKSNDFAEVISVVPLLTLGGIDSEGWVLGGQAGHNWQFGPWVAGLEIDFSAARIRGDSASLVRDLGAGVVLTDTVGDDVKWLGTARGRLGFTPFDSVLFYGTAGLAWERVNRTDTQLLVTPGVSQTVITTDPRDWFGWVAGAGVEAKLFGSPNWIGRLEYLHYDFGTVESNTVVSSSPGVSFADRGGAQTIDVVRAGISYRLTADQRPLEARAQALAGPVAWSWSGFYIGAHGGYGWKSNDFAQVVSVVPLLTVGGIDSEGWVLGGQAGHNWQFGRWVAGLEIDFSAARIRGDSAPVVREFGGGIALTDSEEEDVKWLGTARGRLGFTPFDSMLFYGTAGLAWERVNRIENNVVVVPGVSQTAITTDPRDWFGWVAGAGVEAKLFGSPNWIGRVEYLHYDFGTVEQTAAVTTTVANQSFADRGGRQTVDVVRAGVSYLFATGSAH